MKPRHYVVRAPLTALTALGLIAAPLAIADPVHPCEREWLPDYSPGICDGDPTSGPLPPDGPVGPFGPRGHGGSPGPGGPR